MQISNQAARMAAGALASNRSTGQASYGSINEMQNSLLAQGRQFTKDYAARFAASGTSGKVSVDDLMAQLKQEFPRYTFTSSKPADVMQGQHQLHIDQANLQKMANDPSYRAEVMGLIKRENASLAPASVQMGGRSVQFQMTGTVLSISNDNPTVDGIPYSGSGTSAGVSVTTSSDDSGSSAKTRRGTSKKPTLTELLQEIAEKRAKARKEEEERVAKAAQQEQSSAAGRVDILV